MKFGFGHVPSEHYRNHVNLVRMAEDLGYDYAWIPDQTFFRDPYVVLAAIAAATEDIQLGVGVTNPYTRHPAMAARAVASLDEIAPGRVNLGIGAGNRKELLIPLGLDESAAGDKCREMAQLVKCLLTEDVCAYKGKYYMADGICMDFRVQHPIPIYIAGRGALVLQGAGEVADGVIIGGLCTPKGIGYAMDQVRKGASRSGRRVADMEVVSWVTCQVTDDREQALEDVKPVVAHIVGGAPMAVLEAIDLPADTIQAIKTTYKEQGIPQSARYVTEQCIDAFTLIGDPESLAERIQSLEAAGVTQLSVLMPPGTVKQHQQRIQQFAESLFPAFG